jgi:hypothetical protein
MSQRAAAEAVVSRLTRGLESEVFAGDLFESISRGHLPTNTRSPVAR